MSVLNDLVALTIRQLEENPEELIKNLPSLEEGYITVPSFKDGVYGTETIPIPPRDEWVEDDGSNPERWNVENNIPEGWTLHDQGDGTPSMEGYMVEMLRLPVPHKKRPKPKGF